MDTEESPPGAASVWMLQKELPSCSTCFFANANAWWLQQATLGRSAAAIPFQKSAEKRKNTSGRNGKDLFTVSGFYFASTAGTMKDAT